MYRFSRVAIVLIILVALLVVAAPAVAQPHQHDPTATLVVTGGDGAPVVGASVQVSATKSGEWVPLAYLATDASGLVNFSEKSDTYRFIVDATDAVAPVTIYLTMERDTAYTVPVTLALVRPVGFIEGVVVSGPARIPMAGAYVYLYKQNADGTWPPASPYIGSPSYTFNTDSGGVWTSGELPYGSYKVRFFTIHTGSQWWAYSPTPDTATVLTLSTPGQRLSGIEGWYNR